jgi:hypothetical protein
MTTQTPKYQAPYPKLYMDKVNVIRYGYDLLGNFDPVGRQKTVHSLHWHYITNNHHDLSYLGHFWRDLKDIYLDNYLPERKRPHDCSISEREYKKLPKKYHALFKERIAFWGKKTYEHPRKWKFNGIQLDYEDARPRWTVILRNPADKQKYFDLCEKLKLFWASEQAYVASLYRDMETADALRLLFMQLAEITTVKYLEPLWKRERDQAPDYIYEEYKAEHDRKDVMVLMMKEKRKREAELSAEYQARKLWMFEKLQEKFNVGKHR